MYILKRCMHLQNLTKYVTPQDIHHPPPFQNDVYSYFLTVSAENTMSHTHGIADWQNSVVSHFNSVGKPILMPSQNSSNFLFTKLTSEIS